jgi:hypothetical protein
MVCVGRGEGSCADGGVLVPFGPIHASNSQACKARVDKGTERQFGLKLEYGSPVSSVIVGESKPCLGTRAETDLAETCIRGHLHGANRRYMGV